MQITHGWRIWNLAAVLVLGATCVVLAQEDEDAAPLPPEAEMSQEAASPATTPTAAEQTEQVMDDLMQQRRPSPVVEPLRQPGTQSIPSRVGAPATRVDVDPAVLGVAPGQEPPPLRREGEFVVERRGRLVRSTEGAHVLFVFEADDRKSPELPMILQACGLLETMENLVQQRGDQVVFKLSGQVHTYRGANYLLPTMMTVEVDQGNVQP